MLKTYNTDTTYFSMAVNSIGRLGKTCVKTESNRSYFIGIFSRYFDYTKED